MFEKCVTHRSASLLSTICHCAARGPAAGATQRIHPASSRARETREICGTVRPACFAQERELSVTTRLPRWIDTWAKDANVRWKTAPVAPTHPAPR